MRFTRRAQKLPLSFCLDIQEDPVFWSTDGSRLGAFSFVTYSFVFSHSLCLFPPPFIVSFMACVSSVLYSVLPLFLGPLLPSQPLSNLLSPDGDAGLYRVVSCVFESTQGPANNDLAVADVLFCFCRTHFVLFFSSLYKTCTYHSKDNVERLSPLCVMLLFVSGFNIFFDSLPARFLPFVSWPVTKG